jgi:Tfp pilus assembly protein PilO
MREFLEAVRYSAGYPLARAGLIAALATSAIVAVSIVIFWWPVAREHGDLNHQVQIARRAAVEAQQTAELIHAYRHAVDTVTVVERKLDTPVRQAKLVESLGHLARKRGVRVLSESYEEGKAQNGYVPLTLDLSLQGNYASVHGFLAEIPNLPAWVEVQEARFEGIREAGGRQVRAQIRLIAYRKMVVPPT